MHIPPPVTALIKANSLPDIWAKSVYFVSRHGTPSTPDYKNTPTIRTDCKLIINNPMKNFYDKDGNVNTNVVMHPIFMESTQKTGIFTQSGEGLLGYIEHMEMPYCQVYDQLKDDDPRKAPYAYVHRLGMYPKTPTFWVNAIKNAINAEENGMVNVMKILEESLKEPTTINQLEILRDMIGDRVGSRRLKANLWIPEIDLPTFEDQPCFQEIKIENLGEGQAWVTIVFRSWDLWGGLSFNLPAICNLIYKEVLEPNGLNMLRLSCDGKDTHIYKANWEDAKKIILQAHEVEDIQYFK